MRDIGVNEPFYALTATDSFFRGTTTEGEYISLNRRLFSTFHGKECYLLFTKDHSQYVFIDVRDIVKQLHTDSVAGYSALNIEIIADIVCEYIGNYTLLDEALWNAFEEEISSEIQAWFGIEEGNMCVVEECFNKSIFMLFELALVIKNYLINARFPLIDTESVYAVEKFENGLLVLRLKSWEELVEKYMPVGRW